MNPVQHFDEITSKKSKNQHVWSHLLMKVSSMFVFADNIVILSRNKTELNCYEEIIRKKNYKLEEVKEFYL